MVGRGLDWRRYAEERRHDVASWSCHEPSRAAAQGRMLVETWVDVGALGEEKHGRGLPLEITAAGVAPRAVHP